MNESSVQPQGSPQAAQLDESNCNWRCPSCGSEDVIASTTVATEPTRHCRNCGKTDLKEKFMIPRRIPHPY